MRPHYRRAHLWCCALLMLLAGLGHISHAETLDEIPNPQKTRRAWVSDMAGVIDDATEARLNQLIGDLERRTTAEMAVVTIRRADGGTPKEFATELLNRWGVGKKGKDNGVLVLLVKDERRLEVETGYGAEGELPDGKVGDILDAHVIPRFKQGDFGGGLFAGVKAMAEVLAGGPLGTASPSGTKPRPKSGQAPIYIPRRPPYTTRPSSPVAPPWQAPRATPYPARNPVADLLTFVLFGVGAFAFMALAGYAIWRSGKRYCPQCKREMRRLSEQQDDAYLAFDQKFEEDLGSVDYRVWRCDHCQTRHMERAARWFSGYEDCPRCRHRTVHVESHTLREPSYQWEGLQETIRTCRFPGCNFNDRRQRSIPRLQRQTVVVSSGGSGYRSGGGFSSGGGSSGGSFGGGSSGGGGAGRSW